MILISHRGNITGRDIEKENSPAYILSALEAGFEVETDVFYIAGGLYLGHNSPCYPVELEFLKHEHLWCHAKTPETLIYLRARPEIHSFYHDMDTCTLTSKGFIWTFNGNLLANTICVLPEKYFEPEELKICTGICSDTILTYKGHYEKIDSNYQL